MEGAGVRTGRSGRRRGPAIIPGALTHSPGTTADLGKGAAADKKVLIQYQGEHSAERTLPWFPSGRELSRLLLAQKVSENEGKKNQEISIISAIYKYESFNV